ncbi:MAG: oligosaccharide flippase family protein [Burkholderiales bacterium]|nr:oligosaccharide flippase family protein [Burkholderiales bacterium]
MTLLQMLVVVRLLDGESFGLYMIVWGLVELAAPLTSAGILPAAQRFLPELAEVGTEVALRALVRTLFWWRLLLVLVGSVLIALGWLLMHERAEAGAAWWHIPLAVFALIASNLLARFVAELLEALLDQKHAQLQRALLAAGRLLILSMLWLTGQLSLAALILGEAVVAACAWMLGEFWLRARIGHIKPTGSRHLGSEELWRFIRDMAGAQVLSATANVGLLRLMVAQVVGVAATGQFAFVQQLVLIGQRYLPSILLANLVRPMLVSRQAGGSHSEVAVSLGLLWKSNVMLSWPLVPAAVLAGDLAIAYLSGGKFLSAGWLFSVLLLGLVSTGQTQILGIALQVHQQTALARNLSWLALSAMPLTWLGSQVGLLGAAAGASGSLLLRALVSLYAVQRGPARMAADHTGVLRFLAALAAATVCGAGTNWFLGPVMAALAFVSVLVVGTWLVRPLSGSESQLLVRLFGHRLRWMAGWSR